MKKKTKKLPTVFNTKISKTVHPMLKAISTWEILSEQLKIVLGKEIHHQWFEPLKPVIISNNVLIMEAPNFFASHWIHEHYQDLLDTLVKTIDGNLSCFVLSHKDKTHRPEVSWTWFSESTTSKIDCDTKK